MEYYPNQVGGGDQEDKGEKSAQQYPAFVLEKSSLENHFVLEIIQSGSFKQSNAAKEITYRARLKHPNSNLYITDLISHLKGLFATVIDEAKRDYGESGVIRIYIQHPKLEKAIIVPPTYLGLLTPDDIIEQIENVLYSSGDIPADEDIEINAAVVELLQGKGRKHITNVEKDVASKRSIVEIKNYDNSCLPRAIIVGYKKLLFDEHKDTSEKKKYLEEYRKVRDSRRRFQSLQAEDLRKAVGIPADRAGTMQDLFLYERYLQVSIVVISSKVGNKKVYNGSSKFKRKIFLYHSDRGEGGHFDTITNINGMMCTQYYCNNCDKGFKTNTQHKCKVWCNICGRDNCLQIKEMMCKDCNRVCRSEECFQAHKKSKSTGKGKNKNKVLPSLCEQIWECPECGMTLKRENRHPSQHECGETKCRVCDEYYLENDHHLCYMRAIAPTVEPEKFIFYDFECTQENGKHVPNFVVAQSICSHCEKQPITEKSVCYECGSRCNICDKYDVKEKEWERNPCVGCGKRQVIFKGPNTKREFCQWLISEQHKYVTAIAHNARAYDAYFIYDYLMENSIIPEPTIFSGSKIMYMKVGKGLNIRILDSLNFLPMPLSKLPKSFGLQELKKGFFPHLYNTSEHELDVLDSLPDQKFYDPDGMSPERRTEFMKWYERHKNEPFDFQKEIKEYCISDVDILLKACWEFRKLLLKQTGKEESVPDVNTLIQKNIYTEAIDPFSYLTIASVCLGIFRSKFLPEIWSVLLSEKANPKCNHDKMCQCEWLEGRKVTAYSELEICYEGEWIPRKNLNIKKEKFVKSPIGLIPPHGYSGSDTHSKESMEWLYSLEREWQNHGKPITIQHARNKSEKIIIYKGKTRSVKYKVDGFFEYKGRKYVCEYNGCNFHGCMKCYPRDRESTMNNGKSMAQRFRETVVKEKRLTELGYVVLTKWSCDFNREKKQPEMQKFLDTLNIQEQINMRDCYFGGRTNGLVLHKEMTEGEKGYYVDFTSLYPDILKYKRFPVGHPIRIINNFEPCYLKPCDGECSYPSCDGSHWALPYFGVMKATFRPPTDLLHPILPLRCNGKLKFPLCYKCACNNEIAKECTCSDVERSFTHTYCTPEIEVALNEGYEIIQVHEVLHWPETEMYDANSKTGGLFTKYINTFLQLKQQASGYPEHVKTEEEEDKYIENYYNHEGILLNKNMIQKNPGLRSISKLALNSFYGKFGQRTNMKKTKFVSDVGELYKTFTDPSKVITDFHVMNENVIEIEFKDATDFEPLNMNTNVVIAAFCTSWARLKLWGVMRMLGSRVLYHDTDSIIFSVKDSTEYIPPLGEYLGQLTNELSCKELGCKNDKCEGHWIEEFVSCGPKNYTYRLNSGEIVCKVRGFSLNHRSSLIINFQSMKDSLYGWMNNTPLELVTVKTEVRRDKYETKVFNRVIAKQYGVVYDKRKVLPDFTTLPYGFRL